MSDRIAAMVSELMNDLYVAMEDPSAILDPTPVTDDEFAEIAAAAVYSIDVPSSSGKTKTYDAANLSSSRTRNVQLLATAIHDLLAGGDDLDPAFVASIRAFIHAVVDAI